MTSTASAATRRRSAPPARLRRDDGCAEGRRDAISARAAMCTTSIDATPPTARGAAWRGGGARLTEVLPADRPGRVLYQLPLAHDIARVAPTCRAHGALRAARSSASKARPFSGEVVTRAWSSSASRAAACADAEGQGRHRRVGPAPRRFSVRRRRRTSPSHRRTPPGALADVTGREASQRKEADAAPRSCGRPRRRQAHLASSTAGEHSRSHRRAVPMARSSW